MAVSGFSPLGASEVLALNSILASSNETLHGVAIVDKRCEILNRLSEKKTNKVQNCYKVFT